MAETSNTTFAPNRRSLVLLPFALAPGAAAPVLASVVQPVTESAADVLARARLHFAEFAKAMDELSSRGAGWLVNAGSRRVEGASSWESGAWGEVKLIRYESVGAPTSPHMVIERHTVIEGFVA